MIVAALPPTAPVRVRLDELGAVDVSVNGKGPFHFVLDTGAGITVLSPACAARLGIDGGTAGRVDGAVGSAAIRRVSLGDLRIGTIDLHDVEAAVVPLPLDLTYQGNYGTIDGIVGASFLRHFAVTMDLDGGWAAFQDPQSFVPAKGAVVESADLSSGSPVVAGSVDGAAGQFLIDTGNDGGLTLTHGFVAANGIAARYPSHIMQRFAGVGGASQAEVVRLDAFALGGYALPQTIATLADVASGSLADARLAGNVGDDVLRRFVLTVDYGGARVAFVPKPGARGYRPYRSTGLQIARRADGDFDVKAAPAQTAGAAAGIAAGDVIATIDGVAVATMDIAQIRSAMSRPTVTVGVLHGTAPARSATIHLVDLLPAHGRPLASEVRSVSGE